MEGLRSSEWYASEDRNGYLHRAWMRRGLPSDALSGERPQIAIANAASPGDDGFGLSASARLLTVEGAPIGPTGRRLRREARRRHRGRRPGSWRSSASTTSSSSTPRTPCSSRRPSVPRQVEQILETLTAQGRLDLT